MFALNAKKRVFQIQTNKGHFTFGFYRVSPVAPSINRRICTGNSKRFFSQRLLKAETFKKKIPHHSILIQNPFFTDIQAQLLHPIGAPNSTIYILIVLVTKTGRTPRLDAPLHVATVENDQGSPLSNPVLFSLGSIGFITLVWGVLQIIPKVLNRFAGCQVANGGGEIYVHISWGRKICWKMFEKLGNPSTL